MQISFSSVNSDNDINSISKNALVRQRNKYVLPILFSTTTISPLEKIYSPEECNHNHYDYTVMPQRKQNCIVYLNQSNINQLTFSLPKLNKETAKNANCSVEANNCKMSINLSPYMYTNSLNKKAKKRENINSNSKKYCLTTKTRVPFSKEEDDKIRSLVSKYGTRKWQLIASFIDGRTPKQCRDRYSNYLVPGYFKGEWSVEEDELLTKLFFQIGPKWSNIQKSFPGRSSNSLKNRWKFFLSRQRKSKSDDFDNDTKLEEKSNKNDFYQTYVDENLKIAEMFSIKNLINT